MSGCGGGPGRGSRKLLPTPICDFVRAYAAENRVRAHMPGHKGGAGIERFDLTEIPGAGVLYGENDVIAESERIAAQLFGTAKTLYSAEGSTLALRAMLCLARLHALEQGRSPRILAGRNAHKSFLGGAALLDLPVDWLPPADDTPLCCTVTPATLRAQLAEMPEPPTAVYITTPDYLGNLADVAGLAAVCREAGCLLLVDNAHGAYLRFLPQDLHPITRGADLCCDSAHKTLPALTGGAYLHLSKTAPAALLDAAESAMQLFASTSPSYLILQSLDALNQLLGGWYPAALADFCRALDGLKRRLGERGFRLLGAEPLKLTLDAKAFGYRGTALSDALRRGGVECELADPDVTVLMLSPENGAEGLRRIEAALAAVPRLAPIPEKPPRLPVSEAVLTPRQALLAPSELLPLEVCLGRVLAQPSVSCPPAVPLAVCGERLTQAHLAAFRYYGIDRLRVVAGRRQENA